MRIQREPRANIADRLLDAGLMHAAMVELLGPLSEGSSNTHCPFHNSKDADALSVDTDAGVFKCHNPDCAKQGGILDLVVCRHGGTRADAARYLEQRWLNGETAKKAGTKKRPKPKPQTPNTAKFTRQLERARQNGIPEFAADILAESDCTPDDLLRLGGAASKEAQFKVEDEPVRMPPRVLFPIHGEGGDLIGLCCRASKCDPYKRRGKKERVKWNAAGSMSGFLNGKALLERPDAAVLILAGESDLMVASRELQLPGFVFVAPSNGEGALPPFAPSILAGRSVVIAFDHDKAGRAGTERALEQLAESVVSVLVWPQGTPEGYDVRDALQDIGPDAVADLVRGAPGDAETEGRGFQGSDENLLKRAKKSSDGAKLKRVLKGQLEDFDGDTARATRWCLSLLAFYTGRDPERLRRVFDEKCALAKAEPWTAGSDELIGTALQRTVFYDPLPPEPPAPARPAPPDPQTTENRALTDMGNADRLLDRYGQDFRFCEERGEWLIWIGDRWTWDKRAAITRMMKQTARMVRDEAADAVGTRAEALVDWAMTVQKASRIRDAIELARPEAIIRIDEIDADPMLFGVENGAIDLRTGELIPPRREDFITKRSPVAYDPNAKCPRWMSFLHETFDGDEEVIRFLQRWYGYCLTGQTNRHIMLVHYGEGANGKDSFYDALRYAMGSYAGHAPDTLFIQKRNDEHPAGAASLVGLRLAVAGETEKGDKLKVSLIKRLTGSQEFATRFMRQNWFDAKREFKLGMHTNFLPDVSGRAQHALWRRIRIVPHEVTIPEERWDLQLPEKLRREAPGILAWLVRGCIELGDRPLDTPAAVERATTGYQAQSDHVGRFLLDCLEFVDDTDRFLTSEAIHNVYERWHTNTNCEAELLDKDELSKQMGGRSEIQGAKRSKKRVDGQHQRRGFRCLAIKSTADMVGLT